MVYLIVNGEENLKTSFSFEKINYLMLMMVDKVVHFHMNFQDTQRKMNLLENHFLISLGQPPRSEERGNNLNSEQLSQLVVEAKSIYKKKLQKVQ